MTPRARTTLVVGVAAVTVLAGLAVAGWPWVKPSRFPEPPADHSFTHELHRAFLAFERGDLTKAELNVEVAASYRSHIETLCDCGRANNVDPDAHVETCAWQRFYLSSAKPWIRQCESIHHDMLREE